MRTRGRVAAVLALLVLGMAVLTGCGRAEHPAPPSGGTHTADDPKPAAPVPTIEGLPRSSLQPDPGLAAFVDACERGVSRWQPGQVDYPARLTLGLGQAVTYLAAVDVRSSPLPPSQVLSRPDARGAPLAVQCALSARLVPVGSGVEVDETDYLLRQFTPTGLVNWSWSVEAAALGDHELRLELRPAVTVDTAGGTTPVDGAERPLTTTSFVTEVEVTGTVVQRAAKWMDDNKAAVGGIAVLVAGAVLALLRFGGQVGETWRDARKKWRSPPDEPGPLATAQQDDRRVSRTGRNRRRRAGKH